MPRAGAHLISLLCGAAIACGSARAFEVSPYHWAQANPGDPISLTYSYSNLLSPGLFDDLNQPISPAFLRQAVEEALGLWASVVPVHFTEVPDSGPAPSEADYSPVGKPQIRIGHHKIDGAGTVKAHAFYPSGTGLSGDVHLDNTDRWAVIGTYDNPDVLGIVLHELGHSLGLAHSEDPNAVMYYVARRMAGPGSGFLAADDIAGMQSIYGPGTGSVSPLVVPEPATAGLACIGALVAGCHRLARRRRTGAAGRFGSLVSRLRGRRRVCAGGIRHRGAPPIQSRSRRWNNRIGRMIRTAPNRTSRTRQRRSRLRHSNGFRSRCTSSSRRSRSAARRRRRTTWRFRSVPRRTAPRIYFQKFRSNSR